MKMLKTTTSLALALIMSVIFGITSFAANLCTVNVKETVDYSKAFECLEILNRERRNAGLNELTMNPSLMEVAVTRAFECNLFFSHDRPNGTSYNTLHDTTTWHGENVASGYKTAAQVMDGWMNSPDHKANMLSGKYKSVGIACVNGVWVQEFSGRYSQQASKPANCTVVKSISCDASNMYMESPYRYKPANLSVCDEIQLLAPKLYLFNQLCYGVDISSYDITTSDSSIATVNGLTLTAHKSGDFSVIYTLKGTNISTSVEFSVEGAVEEEKPSEPKNISECTFTISKTEYTYSGKENKPVVTVKAGNYTLNDSDFDVHYENNVNAGCAKVYVTGKGEYTGTKELFFDIYMKNILDGAELEYYECEADGTQKKPKLITNTTAVEGVDYTVTYSNNVESGIGIAYIEATNINYYGWGELYFNINEPSNGDSSQNSSGNNESESAKTNISDCTVTLSRTEYTYSDSENKPTVTVKDGSKTLVKGTDFNVRYENNIDAGCASAYITGIGRYEGTKTLFFDIYPKVIDFDDVKLEYYECIADGTPKKPKFIFTDVDLEEGVDFITSYKDNVKSGIGIAYYETINPNFVGWAELYFNINMPENEDANHVTEDSGTAVTEETTENVETNEKTNTTAKDKLDAEVIIEHDSKTSQSISVPKTVYSKNTDSKPFYLNAKAKSKLAYKTSNSKVVTVNSNGKVTIKGIGKAIITITAVETDNYEKAVKKLTVTVKPTKPKIKSLSVKNDKLTIRWDKLDDNITGYQIAYKRVGSESYRCKTYKGSSLTKKTLKGFSGGTYYVKMRTYKIVNGKRVYSSWCTVKKIIISS